MTKSKFSNKSVLLIIVVVAIVGAVFYLINNYKNNYRSSFQENTNQSPNVATYTNPKYGFEFQYDSETKVSKELETNDGRLLINVSSEKLQKAKKVDDVVFFALEVSKRPCSEWMKDVSVVTKTIAGIESLYFEGDAAYSMYRRSACLTKGDNTFFFVQDITYPEHKESSGTRFNQILSSFKFIR